MNLFDFSPKFIGVSLLDLWIGFLDSSLNSFKHRLACQLRISLTRHRATTQDNTPRHVPTIPVTTVLVRS